MAVAFIVGGYAVLLLAFGPIGLAAILLHVAVMAFALKKTETKKDDPP